MLQPTNTTIAHQPNRGQLIDNVSALIAPDPAVYQDLTALAGFMPENYRKVFSLRWGLGSRAHSIAEISQIVGDAPGTVRSRLDVCLWNCHRAGQHQELPAIRRLLGPSRQQWAARAWEQAERWDQLASRMAETRLLLATGGMDVPQIHQVVGQHATEAGSIAQNPWGAPLTRRERAQRAKPVVDRILEHTIWPRTPHAAWTPATFGTKRILGPNWIGQGGRGYFHSHKLDRMVMYESQLEHVMLRHLDADHRVVDMLEQPFTIPVVFASRQHLYTPDVIVRLADGRVLVLEVKGPVKLGEFSQWMRWTALARYCELKGYGLYIGNCETGSILDHYQASLNNPYRDLVRALAEQGAGNRSDNHVILQGEDPILVAQAVTGEMLAWEQGAKGGISNPSGTDLGKARVFWLLIAAHTQYLARTRTPTANG